MAPHLSGVLRCVFATDAEGLVGKLKYRHKQWKSMFQQRPRWPLTRKVKQSESEIVQSCLTLCDPMNCSLPGSSVHGIFQGRVLEWVAISFSKGSS